MIEIEGFGFPFPEKACEKISEEKMPGWTCFPPVDPKNPKREEELVKKLIELNLPEPDVPREDKIWIREVATGFRYLGLNRYTYGLKSWYSPSGKRKVRVVTEYDYNQHLRKYLSEIYGFGRPSYLVYADCLVASENNWVIEAKEKLNYESVGQVLIYKQLMEEDYPWLGNLKMGIVCSEGYGVERSCERLGIEVFVIEK
jgi:hypothetical protein